MKIRTLFLLCLLIIGFQSNAQNCISLNGTWKFALAKTKQEADRLDKFHLLKFATGKFSSIPVPSNWAVLGYEEPVYRGFANDNASEGFYLRDFTIPEDWKGKRVLLHFGGVWSSAEVWVNDNYLGRHDSGYTSFAFDVTGKLKTDIPNRLSVRVRQVTREYKLDVFDDWTLGGIYRDVTLEAMPSKRWLDHIVVQTTFDNQFEDADLEIRTMVSDRSKTTLPGNYPSPGEPYHLRFTLFDKEGNKTARREIEIPAHGATDREISQTFHVESPYHWTAETPYLYNLHIDLIENNEITHTRIERVGFRQISTEGGVFRINGQVVKLRGVNRHDEHPDVGRATTREHWLQDIMLMKAANINYIRMAHYSHAKGFIELCDELGMYVGSEVSLARGGGASQLMVNPSYSGAALVRSYETIVRDINSPSVIYWSVGNEIPLTTLLLTSIKLVKALDPTRPVLIPWRSEEWLPKEVDILSSHYWEPHEYDKLAGQANRPIITTEYSHAYGVNGFGGLEARWKALTKHPAGAGGAIWMWADQGLKTPIKRPAKKYDKIAPDDEYMRIDDNGWDGIVDSYRNPTRDYWETKAVYAQVYPTVNEVSFVPKQASVQIPIQNDFDFTDLNTIKIAWSIKEDERELASGTGSIKGRPHATAIFELPIECLETIRSGKTYYAWLSFTNISGMEICRKTVELIPVIKHEESILVDQKILVTKGETAIVEVGKSRYIFNSSTGHLESASLCGETIIAGLKPTIWHKLDECEAVMVRKKTDLNNYTSRVSMWNIEESKDKVTINAKVEYVVNEKNSFTTVYRYSIGTDEKLKVYYEIFPKVEVSNLPIVGMSLQTIPGLNHICWLGLGPYDAYPNKQAAPILGVWGGMAGSREVVGNKATRWIERTGPIGRLHISHIGYMEHNEDTPERISILSDVLSKPQKGWKPDVSFPLLPTDTGEPFIGEFCIILISN